MAMGLKSCFMTLVSWCTIHVICVMHHLALHWATEYTHIPIMSIYVERAVMPLYAIYLLL